MAAVLMLALLAGCGVRQTPEGAALEARRKEEDQPIFKKTTQDIGKFDPAAGREVSDGKIRATDPVFGPLQAYGPIMEQISKMNIDQLVLGFNIEHGRWPTYDEFMTQIVKQNNVQLPVLPAKMEYQYDEANHKLVVVYPEKRDGDGATDAGKPAGAGAKPDSGAGKPEATPANPLDAIKNAVPGGLPGGTKAP